MPITDLQTVAALQAENAKLCEQLSLRDRALDAAPSFFMIAEVTSAGPKVMYVNRSIAESHGFTQAELLGQSVKLMTPVDWSTETLRDIDATLKRGEAFRTEGTVHRKDGSNFVVGVTVTPLLNAAGDLTHTVSIASDITNRLEEARAKQALQDQLVAQMQERERILIELRLAQKLESVGRLAAGLAHEINTPVQYVGDSLYILRSAFKDIQQLIQGYDGAVKSLRNVPAATAACKAIDAASEEIDLSRLLNRVGKALERAAAGTASVASIVKAMREFSRPDAGSVGPADLNQALLTTLTVASHEYKHLATVQTQFSELPPVICNIGELNQVFLNMIVNAAHAVADAGKDIHDGKITVVTQMVNQQAQITFSDNGCGIAAENLDKIYDPFFTTRQVGRGSGQGLTISRSIVVDKHGGQLEVDSAVGIGTRFTILLPIDGGNRADSNEACLAGC